MNFKPTIIQPPQIEGAIRGEIMAIRIPKDLLFMCDEDMYFFLDLLQIEQLGLQNLDLTTLRTHTDLRRYFYFTGDLAKLSQEISKSGEWDYLNSFSKLPSQKILQDPDFSPTKLLYFYSNAHLFYPFRGSMPLTRPYRIGYIGGVTNGDYDLQAAERILRANPWVSEIEFCKIPYYNQGKGRNAAVEYTVCLPQEVHDQLVTYHRDTKGDKFWSCRIKEGLGSCYGLEPFDVLGLRAALKQKKQK